MEQLRVKPASHQGCSGGVTASSGVPGSWGLWRTTRVELDVLAAPGGVARLASDGWERFAAALATHGATAATLSGIIVACPASSMLNDGWILGSTMHACCVGGALVHAASTVWKCLVVLSVTQCILYVVGSCVTPPCSSTTRAVLLTCSAWSRCGSFAARSTLVKLNIPFQLDDAATYCC